MSDIPYHQAPRGGLFQWFRLGRGKAPYERAGSMGEVWSIAYPLIITDASHTMMQFMDRKFLSMYSTEAVAAALPAGILALNMFLFFMVTVGFTSAIVSQFDGKKDHKGCARAPWSAFYLSLIAVFLCFTILPYLGHFIINIGGHSGQILQNEHEYFGSLLPSGGFVCITMAFCTFFTGRGKTWYVAAIHLSAMIFNIILNYMLIFGNWGAPTMGITGAGLGTTLATAIGSLFAFILFMLQDQATYPTRSSWRLNVKDIKRLIKFGSPNGLQTLLDISAFTFCVFLIGKAGEVALAATTLAMSINMFSFMPMMGLGEATSVITGRYIGRNQKDLSVKAAYNSWKLAAIYEILMGCIFLFLPMQLMGFFSPREAGAIDFDSIMQYGRVILACAACYNFFDATFLIFSGALRGAGDTKYPMWLIISFAWGVLVPGMLILVLIFKAGVIAIWVFITIYVFILSVMIFLRFRSGKWKNIQMIKDNQ